MADCKDCEAKNIEHVEDHPDQCCACFDISCGQPPGDLLREQRKHYEDEIARLRAEVEQARRTSQFHKDNHLAAEKEIERLERVRPAHKIITPDPAEVRRALDGYHGVHVPDVILAAARAWLASLPPNTTTPAPTCDEPRVIESMTWCLYPVGDGTLWAISHRRTGGLVEGASSAEMRELRQMLPPDTTTAAPDVQQPEWVAPLTDVLQVAMCPTCKVRWATCQCALTPEEQQSAPDVQAEGKCTCGSAADMARLNAYVSSAGGRTGRNVVDEVCRLLSDVQAQLDAAVAREREEIRANLTDNDVFTLIGHAEILRGKGEADMPDYCLDLAQRIALARGDKAAAERVAEIRARSGAQ